MFRQALVVAILSGVFFLFFHIYIKMGFNYHYKKHHPGDCRQVEGLMYGSEDFQVTEGGLAFITSGVNIEPLSKSYNDFLKNNNVIGRIYLYDFNQPKNGALELKIKPSKTFDLKTFQPHGVSLLEDKAKEEHLLYVVNHPKGGNDRVEKFRFIPATLELEHIKFFNDSKFALTNDLALVSEDKFYISNYLTIRSQTLTIFETFLPLGLGTLLYVDGDHAREVVTGLNGPNGITLSKDKKYLYVAFPLEATVHVYERQKGNSLKLVQDVPEVYTLVDNFQLTHSGDALIVGSHPIPHKFFVHLDDPTIPAPSAVFRLPLSNGRIVHEEITELFYDHGNLISGSTSAQVYDNQLLIGSVINKLVVCDLYVKQGKKNANKS